MAGQYRALFMADIATLPLSGNHFNPKKQMMNQTSFLRLAAIAAFLTAFTTLGVHFIDFQADTFEERLLFGRNPAYLSHKWMIIFHCLLVIVSMFGAATVAARHNRGLAALSALFFSVFGVAEMTRMFAVLAWLNPLKEKYLAATEEPVRQILKLQLENFGQASAVLFLLFILAFSLGNLFMGLALPNGSKTDRWVAWGFLFWSALTFLAFGNDFWETATLNPIIEANNKFFQPAFRAVIGWWLWQKSRQL